MSGRPTRLSDADIERGLAELPGWRRDGDAIARTFEFADFVAAFGFMSSCALVAERLDHHPEWSNVYRTVRVRLTTHDARGLTRLDLDLAREMDRLAAGQVSASS